MRAVQCARDRPRVVRAHRRAVERAPSPTSRAGAPGTRRGARPPSTSDGSPTAALARPRSAPRGRCARRAVPAERRGGEPELLLTVAAVSRAARPSRRRPRRRAARLPTPRVARSCCRTSSSSARASAGPPRSTTTSASTRTSSWPSARSSSFFTGRTGTSGRLVRLLVRGRDAPGGGEASPQYTGGPTARGGGADARGGIRRPKLIYLVRDPIERIVSSLAAAVSRAWSTATSRADGRHRSRVPHGSTRAVTRPSSSTTSRAFRRSGSWSSIRPTFSTAGGRRCGGSSASSGSTRPFDSPAFDELRNRSAEAKRRMRHRGPLLPSSTEPAPSGRLSWPRAADQGALLRPLSYRSSRPGSTPGAGASLGTLLAPEAERLRALTGQAFPGWSV